MYSSEIVTAIKRVFGDLRKFDLVYIYTVGVAHFDGIKIARSQGLPTIMTWHTHFEEYLPYYVNIMPMDLTRYLTRKATTVLCNAVDVLVAPSNVMQAELRQRYGVKSGNIHAIPTGIDTYHFTKERGTGLRFRQKYGISPETPILLFAGRVAFEKNIGFLIRMLAEVVKEVSDTLLIIAGDGQARQHHQKQAESLGLITNVLFVGNLSYDRELLDCYSASDVFVFASRTETQGLVILEAMAMGLPVVSTAQLGTIDTLGNEYSMVVEENEREFAKQTVCLLRDGNRRQTMGAAGVKYVRAEWTVEQTTSRLLQVCEGIVSEKRVKKRDLWSLQSTWNWLLWHIWRIILLHGMVPVYTFTEHVVALVQMWWLYFITMMHNNAKTGLESRMRTSAINNIDSLVG
ncbi:hypothetical protein F5884DRAFT_796884 [Xylogone sp. PMI_703]|nr:hypothetical protein F5884DRAFT_796884 [Xylogone sp. PMI_703]